MYTQRSLFNVALIAVFLLCACSHDGPGGTAEEQAHRTWQVRMDSARTLEFVDPGKAAAMVRKARAIADSAGLRREGLEAQRSLAYNLARMGDTSAVAMLDSVVAGHTALGDTLQLLNTLRIQGDALLALVRPDAAAAVLERGIALAEGRTADREVAQLHTSLGAVRSRQGRNGDAVQALQRGLEASFATGDPNIIATSYAELATKQVLNGEVEQATINFDSCIAHSHRHALAYPEAVAHANLAYLLTWQGDLPRAADHFQRAADMQEEIGNRSALSTALYGLASVLVDMGDRVEAYNTFGRALALERELGDVQKGALFQGGLGMLLMDMDTAELTAVGHDPATRYQEALAYMDTALAASKAMQHHEMTAGLQLCIGSSLVSLGRNAQADAPLHEGLELYQAIGDRMGYARGQWHLGVWADSLGHRELALQHLSRAIALADSTSNKNIAARALGTRHAVYRAMGRVAPALADMERAAALDREIHNEANTAHVTRNLLRSQFVKEQQADSVAHAEKLAEQERTATERLERQRSRTWMAVGLGGALLAVGAVVYTLDRRRRRERFARQAAQLETKALRAQMNPHFLFNALNSISAFIRQQEPEKAHAFIARFSKLMRLVLENSRRAEVPLKDDLEALRLYMELEQARSGDKFDLSITVDPAIDQEAVLVPPMVVQPFVENAIWHGIGGLERRGRVEVGLRPSEDRRQLVMSVMDDGVGRAATTKKGEKHASLGTTITRERLQLLARQTGGEAWFRYADLQQGTRVDVSIPWRTA
jgi:tetratricopeptide (TPR) repeat protein